MPEVEAAPEHPALSELAHPGAAQRLEHVAEQLSDAQQSTSGFVHASLTTRYEGAPYGRFV